MIRILFLVVAFNNHVSIESFLESLVTSADDVSFEVAICDNSSIVKEWHPSHWAVKTFITRPDNPGYLGGALIALDAYVERYGSLPEWVVLTNTDLTFVCDEIRKILIGYGDSDFPVVLAPRISEGSAEMNPLLSKARPSWRHGFNRAVTRLLPLAYSYILVNYVRKRARAVWPQYSSQTRLAGRGGKVIYSPYGAMVIFSRGFFSQAELPRLVPLLTEEFVIAEAARRGDVPIVYEPRIHVEHIPHSTTGPAVSLARAKLLREAFRFIRYYSVDSGKVK